jgi:hypothetical protein
MDSHGHPHICINVIAPEQNDHRFLCNAMPDGFSACVCVCVFVRAGLVCVCVCVCVRTGLVSVCVF